MKEIKLLLVTGNYELNRALKKILEDDTDLKLVAEANNAFTARDKIIECEPDVMLLANELPKMSGITFLEKLTLQYPLPTVMLAAPEYEDMAYDAGAADFIAFDEELADAYSAIETLHYENIAYRLKKAVYPNWDIIAANRTMDILDSASSKTIIAMGASTGGTEAIATVIRSLKRDIPGIVMVQHMPEGFTQMYAQRLDDECEVTVKEAKSGDIVKRGQVLLAPGDKHMRLIKVNGMYQVECRVGPKVSGHRPSVDVLFESVAKAAGKDAVGVLMTGMGRDGAQGLLKMKNAGARTIGQDEKTCVVYGMPKAAYDIGAVTWQVPLGQIAQKLYYILDKK